MSVLFTPYKLGSLSVSNRIAIAPMCQYSATDGNASDWHMIHLGSLALSGAGLLCIEATAVEPEGRITYADLGLWSQQNADSLAPVLAAIRRHSHTPVLIQLAHAGRKASTDVPWAGGKQIAPESAKGWQTLGPSAIAYAEGEHAPLAMDDAALQRVKEHFVAAAVRAEKLGLDGIELHGAHGYLLHQFLSPLSNRRTDAYGGSLENRMRYPLEIFDAVRAAVGIPVGIRISATDWVEGGWDVEQSMALARELARHDCAFIHVSSAGLSPHQKIVVKPGYQVDFAARIRAASGLPTIAVGLITDAAQAEQIVAEGQADMVAMARAMLYDARWPWHAAAELGSQVDAPEQYWRSQPHGLEQLFSKRRTAA